ncbi:hypothetical protein [Flavimarina sp. Hel_I_48]|uniref:hypothetical protein n=1 Tax=Flavimarina sp. Hel_I_48 TaxID=1392488 RepID=UPI00068B2DE6|nr:hypothetical protein [Flavimarina sp. Hel_I_48]
MKNLFILVFCMVFNFMSLAQITFEKGYYISNLDTRIDGYIKNEDWKNNPTKFEFKAAENEEPKIITLKYAKEFAFENKLKYIRETVNLDRSSNTLNQLDNNRQPQLVENELFLKVLVEGDASLYRYEDGNLTRYFYKQKEKPITALIYKEYMDGSQDIKKNEAYKQELYSSLKCSSITLNDAERLRYISSDLERLFIKYNTCQNPDYSNTIAKRDRQIFHLNIRPGVKNASLDYERFSTIGLPTINVDFDRKWSLRIGLEGEFILPFNKDKWAVILEPTYQSYNAETDIDEAKTSVDYKSIELPLGVRHYFFLNEDSKIFVNASFILDFPFNSTFIYKNRIPLDIKSRNNFALGTGFKYGDSYSLEFRYDLNRNVLSDYIYYNSNYGGFSIIFGYTLF